MEDLVFKIDYFEPSMHSILTSYTCSICSNIYNNPVQDDQGHIFCRRCILSHLDRSQTCPYTNDHKVDRSKITSIEFMRNFVNSLNINCPARSSGCSFFGKVKNLPEHMLKCSLTVTKALILESNESLEEATKEASAENEQSDMLIPCCFSDIGCREVYLKGAENFHFSKMIQEHLVLLFNKFNSEFVRLEERINKVTLRSNPAENSVEVILKKMRRGDTEEDVLVDSLGRKQKNFEKLKMFSSPGLSVDGNYLTVMNGDNSSKHLFYIFNEPVQSSFALKLEVVKFNQWIGVGMCDYDVVKDNEYAFKIKSLEHGLTCFGFNGFKFNQYGEKKNKITDFPEVVAGMKVKLVFDFASKVLSLVINGKDWRISKVDTDRNLFPCILMLGKQESVKLLGYKRISN